MQSPKKIYDHLKRGIDIIGSLFCLIVFLPVFILVAIWIKKDSGGPIIYKQKRVGRYDIPFYAWKFRSMTVDDSPDSTDGITTPDKQIRITKSGKFMRKYRIDELAQLWNVLIGEMSLVGPRPQTPKYIAIYPKIYSKINVVRPGITGLASIRFHEREERMLVDAGLNADKVYIDKILPLKFKYNLFYVSNYSLCLDIKIVWWTITGMLGKLK